MTAVNSGVTPAPGWSYSNQFLYYSRDESKGPGGEVVATGQQAVLLDMNTIIWVSRQTTPAGRSILLGHRHPAHRRQFTHVGRSGDGERRQRLRRFVLSAAHPGLAVDAASTAGSPSDFSRPPAVSLRAGPTTSARDTGPGRLDRPDRLPHRKPCHGALGLPDVRVSRHPGGHRNSPRPEPRSRLFGNAAVSAWRKTSSFRQD